MNTATRKAASVRVLYLSVQTRIQNSQQSSRKQFSSRIFPLNLVLLVAIICYNSLYIARANDLQLEIGLGNYGGNQLAEPAGQQSELMTQIIQDHYNKDFEHSINALNTLDAELTKFLKDQEMLGGAGKKSNLAQINGGSKMSVLSKEFDFIKAYFWNTFRKIVVGIIEQRPVNFVSNLDFRCKLSPDLENLKQMSLHSSLLNVYLDIFFPELYTHCLTRKLAMIKLNRVRPSPVLKQFVEIYLDLPASIGSIRGNSRVFSELFARYAINFNLETALARHGTLSKVADQVLGPMTALGNNEELVRQFKIDCKAYTDALIVIWGELDTISSNLSTGTNNLLNLNNHVKFVAPQLVYGSVCNQLMAR